MAIMQYDRQGNPLDDAGAMAAFDNAEGRRVDKTEISEDVRVSTVHLMIDHAFGDGPPLIFETMVFGGEHEQECWRYSAEAQAQAGHDAVVAWLRGDGPEPQA